MKLFEQAIEIAGNVATNSAVILKRKITHKTTKDSVIDASKELSLAAMAGDLQGCIDALKKGGKINSSLGRGLGDFPLQQACSAIYQKTEKNRVEVVKYLISMGADTEFTDHPHIGPVLIDTARSGSHAFVQALLEGGANVNAVDPMENENALHNAAARRENHKTWDLLIEYKINLDAQTKNGDTALHSATYGNNPACVRKLLDSGANPDIKNKAGLTFVELAENHKDRDPILAVYAAWRAAQIVNTGCMKHSPKI